MKAKLRQQALHRRSLLSVEEKNMKSNAIVERLLPLLEGKKTIGIYIAMPDEVDVTSLLFVYSGVGAPKVRNTTFMDFFLIHERNDLETGCLGILEPKTNVLINPNDLDAIVVPLVAFDENKNRIGHGKGYYDRYLATTKALKIGVAFETQKVEPFVKSEFDVTLDYIVSESKVYG